MRRIRDAKVAGFNVGRLLACMGHYTLRAGIFAHLCLVSHQVVIKSDELIGTEKRRCN